MAPMKAMKEIKHKMAPMKAKKATKKKAAPNTTAEDTPSPPKKAKLAAPALKDNSSKSTSDAVFSALMDEEPPF